MRTAILLLILATSLAAQAPTRDVLLENEYVRVIRVTLPQGSKLDVREQRDTIAIRLEEESATFIPKGTKSVRSNSSDHAVTDLFIQPAKHWEAEVHPCAEPMHCTHETRMDQEVIATTTSLFTNGFLTASKHKVVPGGTLNSSYYSANGVDHIVLLPFTDLQANFDGIEKPLKAGQPYLSAATQVEVTAKASEVRWFVLRINSPSAPPK